jgi:hypothetical protein
MWAVNFGCCPKPKYNMMAKQASENSSIEEMDMGNLYGGDDLYGEECCSLPDEKI